jgi:hypothetical protein
MKKGNFLLWVGMLALNLVFIGCDTETNGGGGTDVSELTGSVTISGTAGVGEILTANISGFPSGATPKYSWVGAGQPKDGNTYRVVNSDKMTKVKVTVAADGFRGSLAAESPVIFSRAYIQLMV